MEYINPEAVPNICGQIMARTIRRHELGSILDYFEDPQHQEEFEKWKEERRKNELTRR